MIMSDLNVVAKIVARPDSVESVKNELLKLITPTRKENGCIKYTLHQDNEDPAVFVFYETWESAACLQDHMNTDHYKNYVNAVSSLIKEKVVNKMTRID
jgi:quinol monooxygenase YgiN